MYLSIVIPVLNEEKKILGDLNAIARFQKDHPMELEVIVVDDGSQDHTVSVIQENQDKYKFTIWLIQNEHHHGKGYVVRKGILHATGQYVLFMDCGQCLPLNSIHKGLEILQQNDCMIVHGSRRMKESHILKSYPLYRILLSRIFHFLSVHYMGIPKNLTDTQCGFKLYVTDIAKKLYEESRIYGFLFDIEIILLARKYGYSIREFPINWTTDRDSRLYPTKNMLQMVKEFTILQKHAYHIKLSQNKEQTS